MWHWDQGHLGYFDFDKLQAAASFAIHGNMASASKGALTAAIGLSFKAPRTHSGWRQYGRVYKTALIISEANGVATPTAIATVLAKPGIVTADEYFHFLAQALTEPNPALKGWSPDATFRYPLLFSLRYLLMKAAVMSGVGTPLNEIIGAYRNSGFVGDETDEDFIGLLSSIEAHRQAGDSAPEAPRRQARESLRVLSQISYLFLDRAVIFVNLSPDDAAHVFGALFAFNGPRANSAENEIQRLGLLFKSGSTQDFFDYSSTVIQSVSESGFLEGGKAEKTHVTIERNGKLRAAFFSKFDKVLCDVCLMDTSASYPWTDRVLDLHHLLPLSSGTRVIGQSTTFDDLVAVCPTCHRGVHRYYSYWLKKAGAKDFNGRDEAVGVYHEMKNKYPGFIHAK